MQTMLSDGFTFSQLLMLFGVAWIQSQHTFVFVNNDRNSITSYWSWYNKWLSKQCSIIRVQHICLSSQAPSSDSTQLFPCATYLCLCLLNFTVTVIILQIALFIRTIDISETVWRLWCIYVAGVPSLH